MRNSIASYKESLSRIALEVLDAAEEARENGSISARQISQLSRSTPSPRAPYAKGTDPGSGDEIAKYKADIQRLQASEAEINVLSFNYAALLKEKEEQLFKLHQENGLLRRSLENKNDDGSISRDENPRTLSNSSASLKGNLNRASSKPRRIMSQENSCSRTHTFGSSVPKQNGFENGPTHQNMVLESTNSESIYKENEKLLEEVKSLNAVLASQQAEMKLLKEQLDNERANVSILKIKLQEEHHLNESAQRECRGLIKDKQKISEAKMLEKELDRNLSELGRVQEEVSRKDVEKAQNESLESLKFAMQRLQKENSELRIEENELEVKRKGFPNNIPEKNDSDDPDSLNASKNKPDEVFEMTSKIRDLEEMLKETFKERDKALQDLSRLKQHLLDKELEDEDKMNEDSKIIEELRTMTEYQRAQISHLENTLRLERAEEEELKKLKSDELHQSNETVKALKQKLANCMSIVDTKNVELQNLQTALGQYYAESEAKERFGRELDVAREETAKLSESLKVAEQSLETSKRENEEISSRLSETKRMLSESRRSLQKLEEDNSKLRHALERSMMTLNRMSLDWDNFVDRRIVIKLLVTYFQRNHSKEVLDLMVRMLGFSEEDKQRIGFAQHSAGKGVVRGVLDLPGRLVGGILGGNTAEASSRYPSENQSFADLWVDFLLKETERERWESSEDVQKYSGGQGCSTTTSRVAVPAQRSSAPSSSDLPSAYFHAKKVPNSVYAKQYQPFEPLDAKFLTVPLSPATPVSPSPRAPDLYCHRETD